MQEYSEFEKRWSSQQTELKKRLVQEDRLDFLVKDVDGKPDVDGLRYIGGVDISFIKGNEVDACAALVILSFPELKVVHTMYKMVELRYPYIPGFLAFREVDPLLGLIAELRSKRPDILPQVIFVDGNGMLHYRGFGLACQLGVLSDIPTIGIGKNLLCVDGLTREGVSEVFAKCCLKKGDSAPLKGDSQTVWGLAFRSTDNPKSNKPIFVSVGHRVSLETAALLTKATSQYRVPEAVRQADLGSREAVRQWIAEREKESKQIEKEQEAANLENKAKGEDNKVEEKGIPEDQARELAILDTALSSQPYINGFSPSRRDADMLKSSWLVDASNFGVSYPHVLRWVDHISSFSPDVRSRWSP